MGRSQAGSVAEDQPKLRLGIELRSDFITALLAVGILIEPLQSVVVDHLIDHVVLGPATGEDKSV